jgi:transposase
VKYNTFIGVDLGDRFSQVCVLDGAGKVREERRVATEAKALEDFFGKLERGSVGMETGTHSPWVSRLLSGMGFNVYVANARKVSLISKNPRKNDRLDALMLARLTRVDPNLLHPVRHRGQEAQAHLAVLKARDALVQVRTALINSARGLLKSLGYRAPSCSAESFHKKVVVPEELGMALDSMVATIGELTARIREYDEHVKRLCADYSETLIFREVPGVGPVTALAFALVIEEPHRFGKSRQVGAYLGLVPRRDQSGGSDPQLRITKAGNEMMRRLLVNAAHYVLGPFGPPSALREWGLAKAGDGSKIAKKKAVVAVARKLAVLLHRLWVRGECYEPGSEAAAA